MRRILTGVRQVLCWCIISVALTGCTKTDYNSGEYDDQFFWEQVTGTNIAKAQTGYYYTEAYTEGASESFRVYYVDPEAQAADIWCYRAECSHDTPDCDGIFGDDYLRGYIYYFGGHVYMISMDDDYFYLERFNEDGSSQKRLGIIAARDSGFEELVFHRGYMYYALPSGIYRMDIAFKTAADTILEYEQPEKTDCGCMFGIEGEIFFTVRNIDGENTASTIYVYDAGTEEARALTSVSQTNLLSCASADGERLYFYRSNVGICRYDVDAGTEEVIYSEEGMAGRDIWTDGAYLYLDNLKAVAFPDDYGITAVRQVQVFDMDGTLKKTIPLGESIVPCFLSDGEYFVCHLDGVEIDGQYVFELGMIRVNELLQGDAETVDPKQLDWFLTGIEN